MEAGIVKEKRQTGEVKESQKLRRYSDRLITAGTGVMLFAVWSIVKALMQLFVGGVLDTELSALSGEEEFGAGFKALVIIILIVTIGAEVGIRIFIGMSGRAEGKGKKKSIAYIILACILIPLYLSGIIYSIKNLSYIENSPLDTIITLIVDITSLYALVELTVSGIMVKRLKKRTKT